MTQISESVARHGAAITEQLTQEGFAVVDSFLPAHTVAALRGECQGLLQSNRMVTSESTRFNAETGAIETYEKDNVRSYNLIGGTEYSHAPRLTEYCVALVQALPPVINAQLPAAALSDKLHTNKLAVCLGDGSLYAKHYDNSGGGDARKLTVLLYLQTEWNPEMGGCFRMYDAVVGDDVASEGSLQGVTAGVEDGHPYVDIAPIGGRLLAFWSDTKVHGVQPSYSASGEASHRWALTVWLHTDDLASIEFDPEMEAAHFAGLQAGQRHLAG